MRKHLKIRLLLVVTTAAFALSAYSEQGMYRYHNANGVTVVDFSIPPQFVAGGYDVITSSGRVIRSVPPVKDGPSREELENIKEQEREDAFLLRSYSSLDDIELSRSRKLNLLEREIATLNANLRDFAYRRDFLRQKAAKYQASGQQTPENISRVLNELVFHEKNTRKLLEERHAQLLEINKQYDRYADRLAMLRPSVVKAETVSSGTDSAL